MYSDKFLKFIQIWKEEFAIEKSIDEKLCEDRDGNRSEERRVGNECDRTA